MNFLKSVFNSSSEFANEAGEAPPYNVLDNVSKGTDEVEVYDCNYKHNNLKELEYICLHNGIASDKVNESLVFSMIRKKPFAKNQIDQYGNPVVPHPKGNIDFLQSANNFVSLFHNENINGSNNVMINILKVYDRFDSFVTENAQLLLVASSLGSNKIYLDYCILKLFRLILKNNYTLPGKDVALSDILYSFIDENSMTVKLYIEGLKPNTGKDDGTVFKLLNQRYPNINSVASLNNHLKALLQKNDFIKTIEFINRVEETSTIEITQLVKSLIQKIEEVYSSDDEFSGKMWQVGIINKIVDRYNKLKKENIENKEHDPDFEEFETFFFKLLAKIVEFSPSKLSNFDYIFLDYIKNNADGKLNIINILVALNICYEKFDEEASEKLSKFPLLLYNSLQGTVRNNKVNNDENLNIVRLFLLLLKSPSFNSKLTDKFICNDILRLLSEVSKQSGTVEAQSFSDIKSLNFLIVVLIVSLKDTVLSFYGSDRGYTILISAILQNSNIQKSNNKSKNNKSLLYDLAILQILKNEISNWPTELIVTKLMPVQSLMNLLLLSNSGDNVEPEVAEANRNISQSAFDIYLHIISRVAKEGNFKVVDKSEAMYSEINPKINFITKIDYYRQALLQHENINFNDSEIPTVIQYDDTTMNNLNERNPNNSFGNSKNSENWSSWSDGEAADDVLANNFINKNASKEAPVDKPKVHRNTNAIKSSLADSKTVQRKSVLQADTRKIPVIKKKTVSSKPKPKANAFPSFESDNEDGWGDDW